MKSTNWDLTSAIEFYKTKGYTLLETEYNKASIKMKCVDVYGYIYAISLNKLQQGRIPKSIDTNNPYTIENIKLWLKLNNINYKLKEGQTYLGSGETLKYLCPKCGEFERVWDNVKMGYGCPICSGKRVKCNINSIYITDCWMIEEMGMDISESKIYSKGSQKRAWFTCKNCGEKHHKIIKNVYSQKSIGCHCSDGRSFGEKSMYYLLKNYLNVNDLSCEQTFQWSRKSECEIGDFSKVKGRRYDFTFSINNINYIMEVHGLQHYEKQTNFKTTLKEQQKIDELKMSESFKNGYNENTYIVIDCRESNIEWLKQNIINNHLMIKIFGGLLDDINWEEVYRYAISGNLKLEVAQYKKDNMGKTTGDIALVFPLDRHTILRYLKQYNELKEFRGIYDKEHEKNLNSQKSIKRLNGINNRRKQGYIDK